MALHGLPTGDFWQAGVYSDTAAKFPGAQIDASQWTSNFTEFVDDLDSQNILTQERGPSAFAYAVYVDGDSYNTEAGLSIMVTVTNELTIMIPSTEADIAKYVDVPLNHIFNIEVEAGGPGSQSRSTLPTTPGVLILHLLEDVNEAYYINESARRPCRINLAFDELEYAELTKDRIEAIIGHRNTVIPRDERQEQPSSCLLGSSQLLSQSVALDVSSRPLSKKTTFNAQETLGQHDMQFTDLVATATQAHNLLAVSDSIRAETAGENHVGSAVRRDRPNRISTSGVLVATDIVNVSQEVCVDTVSERERNSLEDMPDLMSAAASCESQSNHADPEASSLDNEVRRSDLVEDANEHDDDLYSASPPAQKASSIERPENVLQRRAANSEIQPTMTEDHPESTSRKLSHSMRTDDNERPPIPEDGRSARAQDGGRTGKSVLDTTRSSGAKRKDSKQQAVGSKKKAKTNKTVADRVIAVNDLANAVGRLAGNDEFDVPATPPGPPKAKRKPEKLARFKPKPSRVAGKPRIKSPAMTHIATDKLTKGAKSIEESNLTTVVGPHELDQGLEIDGTGSFESGENNSDFQPSSRGRRKPKSKANTKSKASRVNQPASVTNKARSTQSKAEAATRRPKTTRAAARTAQRRIHESERGFEKEEDEASTEASLTGKTEAKAVGEQGSSRNDHEESPADTNKSSTASKAPATPTERQLSEAKNQESDNETVEQAQLVASAAARQPVVRHPADSSLRMSKNGFHAANDATANGPNKAIEQQTGVAKSNVSSVSFLALRNSKGALHALDFPSHIDAPDLSNKEINLEVKETNFEDAVAVLVPDIGDVLDFHRNPREDEDDGDILIGPVKHAEMVPAAEKRRIAVFVSGKGGVDAERTDERDSPDRNPEPSGRSRIVLRDEKDEDSDTRPKTTDAISGLDKSRRSEEPSVRSQVIKSKTSSNLSAREGAPAPLATQLAGALSGLLNNQDSHPEKTEARGKAQGVILAPSTHSITAARARDTNGIKTENQSSRHEGGLLGGGKVQRPSQSNSDVTRVGPQQILPRTQQQLDRLRAAEEFYNTSEKPRAAMLEPVSVSSGPSSECELTEAPRRPIAKLPSRPPHKAPRYLPELSRDSPPVHSSALSSVLSTNKRDRDVEDQRSRKRIRLPIEADERYGVHTPNTEHGVHKDPGRIPQLISFNAKGPRNQGLPPLEINPVPDNRMESQQETNPKQAHIQNEKREHNEGHLARDDNSEQVPAQTQEHWGFKKARIDKSRDTTAVPQNFSVPASGARQPSKRAQIPLLEHSSLFAEDYALKVSSQSSRVDENGSPLPYRHTRQANLSSKRRGDKNDGFSDSENIGPLLVDDEITLIHRGDDEECEPELPVYVPPKAARKHEVAFIRPSNSKNGPSSPSAPSAMLTEAEAHKVHPLGLLVNMQTDAVIEPSAPQDPFTGQKNQRTNGFLNMLRRANEKTEAKARTTGHEPIPKQRNSRSTFVFAGDPDATLVDASTDRPRKRKPESPTTTSTSKASSSRRQSQSSHDSSSQRAAAKRWRDALEPYQENMLRILCEISHDLIGHLIDAEAAIQDVVNVYQRRAGRMIKNLADDIEQELGHYMEGVKLRHSNTGEKMRKLQSKVGRNLEKKPATPTLLQHMKDKRKMVGERMEEAMRLCEQRHT
ncbi:MAG: hypothetical protein Q9201_001169 [Fulgogasparrea decipioides]